MYHTGFFTGNPNAAAAACPNPPLGPVVDWNSDGDLDYGMWNTDFSAVTSDVPAGSNFLVYDADGDADFGVCDDNADGLGELIESQGLIFADPERQHTPPPKKYVSLAGLDADANISLENATLFIQVFPQNGESYSFTTTLLFPGNATIWIPENSTMNITAKKEGFYDSVPLPVNDTLYYGQEFDIFDPHSLLDHTFLLKPKHPPVLAPVGNFTVNESVPLAIQLNATDADNDTLLYLSNASQVLKSQFNFSNATGLLTWTPNYVDAGTYQIYFEANDSELSDNETITVTVLNVNAPPILAAIGNQSVDENQTLSFQLAATDVDNDTLAFATDAYFILPSAFSFNTTTGAFSWKPTFLDAGNYTVQFVVTDGELFAAETITITVINVNLPPVLAFIGNKTIIENETVAIQLSATDTENDTLVYATTAGSVLPSSFSFTSSGLFSWTPTTNDSGNYTVLFSVSDGQLNDSELIKITVLNVPPSCTDNDHDGFFAINASCSVGNDCNDQNSSLIGIRDAKYATQFGIEDTVILQDSFFCPGSYGVKDTANNGAVIVNASGVSLDCMGAFLNGSETGIGFRIASQANVTLKNCFARDLGTGFLVTGSTGILLRNATAFSNPAAGIFIVGGSMVTVNGSNASLNGNGIVLSATADAVIENATVRANTQSGVLVNSSSIRAVLRMINATQQTGSAAGILISGATNTTVLASNLTLNGYGISVQNAGNTTITQSNASSNTLGGFFFSGANTSFLSSVAASSNPYGINLQSSHNSTIVSPVVVSNSQAGILVQQSQNNTVISPSATGNLYGVQFNGAARNLLAGGSLLANTYGVALLSGSNFNTLSLVS